MSKGFYKPESLSDHNNTEANTKPEGFQTVKQAESRPQFEATKSEQLHVSQEKGRNNSKFRFTALVAVCAIIAVLIAVILFLLFGNKAKSASESEIINQITAYYNLYAEEVKDFRIDNRNSNIKEGYDTVNCTLITEDSNCHYERSYVVHLVSTPEHDNADWKIDYINCNSEQITPIHGADESEISSLLSGTSFTIDNEEWTLSDDTDYEVSNQNTDTANGVDIMNVSFCAKDVAMEARGAYQVHFAWDGSKWIISDVRPEGIFTAQYKENCAPSISADDVLSDVCSKGVHLDDEDFSQIITISEDCVENFTLTGSNVSDKGSVVQQQCTFNFTKGFISFAADSVISYRFSNGIWSAANISTSIVADSINISGVWSGEYIAARDGTSADTGLVFTLENYAEDGSFTGIMEITPYAKTALEHEATAGSFSISGVIDKNTLRIMMKPSGWIVQPKRYALFDFDGQLLADDEAINGEITFHTIGSYKSAINLTR